MTRGGPFGAASHVVGCQTFRGPGAFQLTLNLQVSTIPRSLLALPA